MGPISSDKDKTGFVLSGGGARGFAHLGVLQALDEMKIRIDYLSGVSAGAIAAVFYASGYSPLQILDIFLEKNYLKYFKISVPNKGFVKNIALYKLLIEKLPSNIEDLQIPTTITVSNLNTGKAEYHTSGPLARMVLASTSIPIIFQPVLMKNVSYVDGGLINNLPIEPILKKCKTIIASHVNPLVEIPAPDSIFKVMERCFHLAINDNTMQKKKKCTVYIEPERLHKFKIFDFNKAPQLFDIGYEAAVQALKKYLNG